MRLLILLLFGLLIGLYVGCDDCDDNGCCPVPASEETDDS
jgi:hypothetical protein